MRRKGRLGMLLAFGLVAGPGCGGGDKREGSMNPSLIGVAALGLLVLLGVGFNSIGYEAGKTVEELLPFARAPHSPIRLEIGPTIFMRAGHFDEDGNPDLVILTVRSPEDPARTQIWSSSIALLRGDGRGGFKAPEVLHVVEHERESLGEIVIGDWNNDGHMDFAVTGVFTGGIWVFWGNGAGEFGKAFLQPARGLVLSRLVSADLDGDGHPDLIASELATRAIYVLWGDEKGEFARVNSYEFDEGRLPTVLTAGDFNSDGVEDVAVLGWRWLQRGEILYFVAVFSTAGAEMLHVLSVTDVGDPGPPEPVVLTTGDYDRDGDLDMVTVRTGWTFLLEGSGDGSFKPIQLYPVFDLDPLIEQVMLVDIDGDGCLNEVLVGAWTRRVWISVGCPGDAVYRLPIPQWSPSVAAVIDINNDGISDLIVANALAPDWTYLDVLLGRKRG